MRRGNLPRLHQSRRRYGWPALIRSLFVAINLYGQLESKTAVDFSYDKLGIKGELDGAGRIWVIHIVEPNKSVSKNSNGIGGARQDVQIEFGKPNRTFSDNDDYIWDGYFSENEFENKIW